MKSDAVIALGKLAVLLALMPALMAAPFSNTEATRGSIEKRDKYEIECDSRTYTCQSLGYCTEYGDHVTPSRFCYAHCTCELQRRRPDPFICGPGGKKCLAAAGNGTSTTSGDSTALVA